MGVVFATFPCLTNFVQEILCYASAYKTGVIYHKIGVVPKALDTRLESILLSDLFFSGDRKELGNLTILDAFKESNILQTSESNPTTQ